MFDGEFDRMSRVCRWNDREFFAGVVTAQWPWEIATAAEIVRRLAPKLLVEIGTQEGGTLRWWLKACPEDARIVCIDPAMNLGDLQDNRIWRIPARSTDTGVYGLFQEKAQNGEPIDVLFIDGDHAYEAAKFDFMTYGPLVHPGGLILLHDIDTRREDCGVPQLWREIQAAGYLTRELMCVHSSLYGGPGGGIGVVYV